MGLHFKQCSLINFNVYSAYHANFIKRAIQNATESLPAWIRQTINSDPEGYMYNLIIYAYVHSIKTNISCCSQETTSLVVICKIWTWYEELFMVWFRKEYWTELTYLWFVSNRTILNVQCTGFCFSEPNRSNLYTEQYLFKSKMFFFKPNCVFLGERNCWLFSELILRF